MRRSERRRNAVWQGARASRAEHVLAFAQCARYGREGKDARASRSARRHSPPTEGTPSTTEKRAAPAAVDHKGTERARPMTQSAASTHHHHRRRRSAAHKRRKRGARARSRGGGPPPPPLAGPFGGRPLVQRIDRLSHASCRTTIVGPSVQRRDQLLMQMPRRERRSLRNDLRTEPRRYTTRS
uniref:Uncharacterized protein n=1 Tax=Plectus sambesii TaxID=2011161 RepID=A0A914UUN3_9BILA